MKLRVLDQIQLTAVRSEVLRPREEVTVDDTVGAAVLESHPGYFEQLPDDEPEAPAVKAEAEPDNKKAPEPKNKSAPAKGPAKARAATPRSRASKKA